MSVFLAELKAFRTTGVANKTTSSLRERRFCSRGSSTVSVTTLNASGLDGFCQLVATSLSSRSSRRGCTIIAPNESAKLALIKWPQLERLIMENVPLIDLSPLLKVCTNCPKLRCLGLKHVGISGTFSQTWKLVQCINALDNLEDFQFEHPDVSQLVNVIDALSQRPKLSRVSIICESTRTSQNISSYLKLIEKCSHLVFLFVCVGAITKKMERDFQKEVKAKFLNERKYLWALLQGALRNDVVESIPFVHYLDMLCDDTQIPFLKD